MESTDLRLIAPTEALRDEFIAYCEEFRDAGERVVHGQAEPARRDFAALMAQWAREAAEPDPGAGKVRMERFWLVRGNRILGTARLRHRLTETLLRRGGHVGYDVRPSERGKGHGTRMLGMVLDRARAIGLSRALVTCDKGNIASARVIAKNGGVLEDEVRIEGLDVTTQRYWIDLADAPRATGSAPGL